MVIVIVTTKTTFHFSGVDKNNKKTYKGILESCSNMNHVMAFCSLHISAYLLSAQGFCVCKEKWKFKFNLLWLEKFSSALAWSNQLTLGGFPLHVWFLLQLPSLYDHHSDQSTKNKERMLLKDKQCRLRWIGLTKCTQLQSLPQKCFLSHQSTSMCA